MTEVSMVEMVETLINERWTLLLPEHRAARPEWPYWEKERLASMALNIGPGDVVFDVGGEEMDLSALYAQWIGIGDGGVVIFEPNERVWANGYAIWNANHLKSPLAFVAGFASDYNRHLDKLDIDHWPDAAFGEVISDHGFCVLHERPDIPAVRIDDFIGMCGCPPTVITIDVEGAELNVLEGAVDTLREVMPLVYCSIHPEFMKQYERTEKELHEYMGLLGYRCKHLADDHERHFAYFHPYGRELRF